MPQLADSDWTALLQPRYREVPAAVPHVLQGTSVDSFFHPRTEAEVAAASEQLQGVGARRWADHYPGGLACWCEGSIRSVGSSRMIRGNSSSGSHSVEHLYRWSSELESAVPATEIIGPDGGRLPTLARCGSRCTVLVMMRLLMMMIVD